MRVPIILEHEAVMHYERLPALLQKLSLSPVYPRLSPHPGTIKYPEKTERKKKAKQLVNANIYSIRPL